MTGDFDRIESALRDSVRTSDAYLSEIASHLIVAGGKRLRPVLTVVAAQVGSTYEQRNAELIERAVQGGISCELVQTGSLYHDDVMDEAPTRRGVETVNAKWGNLQAILAGDFLLSRASEIAASLGMAAAVSRVSTSPVRSPERRVEPSPSPVSRRPSIRCVVSANSAEGGSGVGSRTT